MIALAAAGALSFAAAAQVAGAHAAWATRRPLARVAVSAPLRAVSVWLAYWNMTAGLASALDNADVVGVASPFWYSIAGDATVVDDPGAGDAGDVQALHDQGIRVIPTVTETDGLAAFERTLASPIRRAAVVRTLLTIARSGAYNGLDLDFEDFAVDPHHDAVLADDAASGYATLVGEVCAALHAIGDSCTVTVMPRTTATQVYWRGTLATWVYDYVALAAVADRVRVMAYDEHAPGGPPGPIAPLSWVREVVAYARSTMPPAKVELALPAYGYDWSGTDAAALTAQQAPLVAAANHVTPSWNAAQAEETFTYTSDRHHHTVWYENATADYDRASLARAAGFAGIDLWSAGGEDPAVWPMLRGLYAQGT